MCAGSLDETVAVWDTSLSEDQLDPKSASKNGDDKVFKRQWLYTGHNLGVVSLGVDPTGGLSGAYVNKMSGQEVLRAFARGTTGHLVSDSNIANGMRCACTIRGGIMLMLSVLKNSWHDVPPLPPPPAGTYAGTSTLDSGIRIWSLQDHGTKFAQEFTPTETWAMAFGPTTDNIFSFAVAGGSRNDVTLWTACDTQESEIAAIFNMPQVRHASLKLNQCPRCSALLG